MRYLWIMILLCAAAPATAKDKVLGPAEGQQVKDFELPITGADETLSLSDQYKNGNVLVVFLRGFPGYQCSICSRQVSAILNRAKTLSQNTSKVILVYPGPEKNLAQRSEEFLGARRVPDSIVMVRDPDMKVTEAWNLRWDARRETAYPSTFVINQNGCVVWKKVSTSHAGRSTVDEIIKALRKTQPK